jgi:hypothetical protein
MQSIISSRLLLLFSLLTIQSPRTASQFEPLSTLSSLYNRRLFQSTIFPSLNLCETDVCEAQRPDGVCDRWSLGSTCPERQVYYVRGDPGNNDKAEMFFTLRSPWNVTCSMVPSPSFSASCLPAPSTKQHGPRPSPRPRPPQSLRSSLPCSSVAGETGGE